MTLTIETTDMDIASADDKSCIWVFCTIFYIFLHDGLYLDLYTTYYYWFIFLKEAIKFYTNINSLVTPNIKFN